MAQRKYKKRQQEKPKKIRFTAAMKQQEEVCLEKKYSPEQIKGYCDKEGIEMVSAERIYQYI